MTLAPFAAARFDEGRFDPTWVDELAEEIAKKGIETIYRKGDRVEK